MAAFRVLYAFQAEEEGELSVSEGENVTASAGEDGEFGTEDDTRDGWVLVEKLDGRIGYVPADYLEQAQAPISQAEHVPLQNGHQDSQHFQQAFPFDSQSAGGAYDSTMDTYNSAILSATSTNIESLTATQRSKLQLKEHLVVPTTPSLANAVTSMNFDQMIQDNEEHATSIFSQQHKVFKELDEGVGVLSKQLEETNTANEGLLANLSDLSQTLEVESRKWKKLHDQDVQEITLGAASRFE